MKFQNLPIVRGIRTVIKSPKFRSITYSLALLILVIGVVISLQRNPHLFSDVQVWPILLVLIAGIPLTLVTNAMRYIFCARLIGISSGWFRAMEVTTISTAANMLPLPGGTAVRLAALSADSSSILKGSKVTVISTSIWVAITLIFGGTGIFFYSTTPGTVFICSGIFLFLATGIGLYTIAGENLERENALYLCLVELVSVSIDAFRFMLCLQALGISAEFLQSASLVIASLVGSAVGIVPAGLGVREIVSAMMGPVVNLPAEACFVSATLNRLIGLVGITPVAGWFVWYERFGRKSAKINEQKNNP